MANLNTSMKITKFVLAATTDNLTRGKTLEASWTSPNRSAEGNYESFDDMTILPL